MRCGSRCAQTFLPVAAGCQPNQSSANQSRVESRRERSGGHPSVSRGLLQSTVCEREHFIPLTSDVTMARRRCHWVHVAAPGRVSVMSMYYLCAIVLVLVLLFINTVNKAVVKSVRVMEEADPFLEVLEDGVTTLAEGFEYSQRTRWAAQHGFEPELLAVTRATLDGSIFEIAVWRNPFTYTVLASYAAAGKVTCEFVTDLSNEGALTTSNSMDSWLYPTRPGKYKQTFQGADLDSLYQRHVASLTFLGERKNLHVINRPEPIADLITESTRKQNAFIQTLPFWKFRGAYWFFVQRRVMNNKSIADQYPF